MHQSTSAQEMHQILRQRIPLAVVCDTTQQEVIVPFAEHAVRLQCISLGSEVPVEFARKIEHAAAEDAHTSAISARHHLV